MTPPSLRHQLRSSRRRQAQAQVRAGVRVFIAAIVSLIAALPAPVRACAACFGKSDDAMARGMNMGIFSLLIVVLFVLSGIGAFTIFLMRRAARFPSLPMAEESSTESGAMPGPVPGALAPLSQPSK